MASSPELSDLNIAEMSRLEKREEARERAEGGGGGCCVVLDDPLIALVLHLSIQSFTC